MVHKKRIPPLSIQASPQSPPLLFWPELLDVEVSPKYYLVPFFFRYSGLRVPVPALEEDDSFFFTLLPVSALPTGRSFTLRERRFRLPNFRIVGLTKMLP